MKRNKTKRINLAVDQELYEQIEKNAMSANLTLGTYSRLLLIKALKNNFIINLN